MPVRSRIYEDCKKHFRMCKREPEIVRIASGTNFPTNYIGQTILDFNSFQSKCHAISKDYSNGHCDSAVENGEADIGFNTGPFDTEKFSCHPFLRYPLYIVANRNHPYAALQFFPTRLLNNLPMVIMEMKSDETEFFAACRAAKVMPDIQNRVERDLVVFQMVSVNPVLFGVTYKEVADVVYFPETVVNPFEDPGFSRVVYLFCALGDQMSPAAKEFERFFLQHLSETPC